MLTRLSNGVRLLCRRLGQPEVEVPTENARPTVDIREYKQQVLETKDLRDLMTLCQRLNISSTGCHTLEQVRERIIAHLKEACCNSSTAVYPVSRAKLHTKLEGVVVARILIAVYHSRSRR
jgi:hypothetical protein